jgi:hypothetical protein
MTLSNSLRLFGLVLIPAALLAAPDDAQLLREFKTRLDQYVKIHREAEKRVPRLPEKATPEQIQEHERALREAIAAARPGANPGDVFSIAEEYFRRVIAGELKGHDGASARKTIKDGNPTHEPVSAPVTLGVNAAYPAEAPVSTVPPALLLRLPQLPEELNYRFVGRHLILHDTQGNLVVDFLLNAAP